MLNQMEKKILYVNATNLYGHSMSQMLPYDEIKFEKIICVNKILDTPDDSDIGHFLEVDIKYPDNMKKTTNLPFAPENKIIPKEKFNVYMNKIDKT